MAASDSGKASSSPNSMARHGELDVLEQVVEDVVQVEAIHDQRISSAARTAAGPSVN